MTRQSTWNRTRNCHWQDGLPVRNKNDKIGAKKAPKAAHNRTRSCLDGLGGVEIVHFQQVPCFYVSLLLFFSVL